MKQRVRRWRNSLAVQIPKAIADKTGLEMNDEITITVQNGLIILTPVKSKGYSLDTLLPGITPENRHREWDMGVTTGNELW